MKEFLDKISPYELLNNFLTGVCFCILIEKFTLWSLISQDESLINCCLFYFVGLIIGRVGSLVIEPLLKHLRVPSKDKKKHKFLEFAEYRDFIEAEKDDSKIDTLSGKNNVYRSMTAIFFCFLLVKIYELTLHQVVVNYRLRNVEIIVGSIILMILFAFSYRKQTGYVKKRVEKILEMNKTKTFNKENQK